MINSEQLRLTELMGIDEAARESRKAFVQFGAEDVRILRELEPLVRANADRIVDTFYENVARYAELQELIGSSIDSLKEAQRQYLMELFSGEYDEAYFERRLRIGVMHHKIGLTPRWYLGSYSIYSQLLTEIIFRKFVFRPGAAVRALAAVQKILSIDTQLAIDTYIQGLVEDNRSVALSKEEIEQRVKEYGQLVERVAEGDLTTHIAVEGEDELAELGRTLNRMTDSLSSMTGRVTGASNSILSVLEQVQEAVNAQSSGAAQQAASVNETTSTLEEIRSTSRQTLEKALSLGEAADRTRAEGENGLKGVEETIAAMRDIRGKVETIAETVLALSEQTQQIGEITGVVNGLAQQSKMLALNASIEAAKAGEAGRGFAVVAAEVKELAEQSQHSTSQVQRILQDIQHAADRAVMAMEEGSRGVERGMELAESTGSAIQVLADVIHDTAMAGQQIVAAVRQEAAGIEQIATAMGEINMVTGQFVSATRQTAAGSDELANYAAELQGIMRQFKVDGAGLDVARAIAAHHAWMVRARAYLDGRESMDEEQLVSHRQCDLGRWFYSDGLRKYGELSEMRNLEEPHAELHRCVEELVRAKHAGDTGQAEALYSRLRELSHQITGLLTALQHRVG